MSVMGIKNRLAQIERSSGVGVPRPRIVFVQPTQDRDRAVTDARLAPNELPLIVQFLDARFVA